MDFAQIASGLHGLTTVFGIASGAVTFVLTSIRLVKIARRRRRRRSSARTAPLSTPTATPITEPAHLVAAPVAQTLTQAPTVQTHLPPAAVRAPGPPPPSIRTPDQRLRVFISSTIEELGPERAAGNQAISRLGLTPVLFELGARPHPARSLYRAYLAQSDIFVGIYWQHYGWVAPGEEISGLEDEYRLSGDKPKLIYLKGPAPDREPRLRELLDRIRADDHVSYKSFHTAAELRKLITNDLAVLLSERFGGADLSGTGGPTERVEPAGAKSSLPLQLTRCVGRESEVAYGVRLLDEHRLVTLTGPGGTGKTRLAIEIAERVSEKFADGVTFVGLAPISDPNLVVRTIAQVLGVPESGSRPVQGNVAEFLRSRQLLLVLDNVEHLLSAVPQVGELLTACPKLTVLATSREPLGLHGEFEMPVPPLAMPGARDVSPEALANVGSVALFVQCAQAILPDFALTQENTAAVAAICQRLDGLPLAIELAAPRLRLLSPQALLGQLGNRLGVLTGGARNLPARQQTLRGAIEWSYRLLAPGEQVLFRGLAVFVGGASVELANEVCATRDLDGGILNGLQSLLAKSLLVRTHNSIGDRVHMLETIRDYALDQLELEGESEPTRRRHAEAFLQLAETANRNFHGAAQTLWLARLSAELDNLRAALSWAEANGEVSIHLRLAASLFRFWWRTGHVAEGRRWLASALARGGSAEPLYRAKALAGAGLLARNAGDYAHAREFLDEAVALSRELHDQSLIADSLLYRAQLARDEGDFAAARMLAEESLALFRAVDDDWGISADLDALGVIVRLQGEYDLARSFHEEALSRARARGEPLTIAIVLANLMVVAVAQGDYAAAVELGIASLRTSRVLDVPQQVCNVLEDLAAAAVGLGQLERGVRIYGAANGIRETLGTPLSPVEIQGHQRIVARARLAMQDDTAFDRAWAAGRALTADQAVEYALQTTPTPSTTEVTA